ncbi:uncharacterized protein LOC105354095 [Oryzias latipes]|uniref:uncharacterized protein LOC105354095 n=1 Tax=Oryzias latipes TaxID=8090 RepID=UPI000CE18F19|nr:uncharacterized protein LOC105354095 [Oryzias latipes]
MTERTGHHPDPADPEGLRLAVKQQGVMLEHQAKALTQMASVHQDLFCRLESATQTLLELTGQQSVSAVPASLPPSSDPPVSSSASLPENFRLQPEQFHGDVEACGGFLLQCQLLFLQAPRFYHSDHSKITLLVNSLRGKALQWAQAFLAANPVTHLSFESFIGFVMPRLSPGTYTTLSCSYLPDADTLRPQHALVPATLVLQPCHSQELQQHPSSRPSVTPLSRSPIALQLHLCQQELQLARASPPRSKPRLLVST